MTRTLVGAAVVMWAGATLVLSELRWFAREPLSERLRVYSPHPSVTPVRSVLSVETFRDVIAPLAQSAGERISRLLGAGESLSVRLERVHSPLDVAAFRMRQLAWSVAATGIAAMVVLAVPLAPAIVLLVLLGGPILAILFAELSIARASAAWQRRLFLELPVVAEQLGMLLSAGYSLGSALRRLASRGHGACSQDLQRVAVRMQQGLTEVEALREWSDLAGVDELDRLVNVLALNREAGDLGHLIAEETRSTRHEVQRQMTELMERRGQQVWIPVTVATLVPGVLFMAVPFVEAMRLFTGD
jgi:tight adherence protein C